MAEKPHVFELNGTHFRGDFLTPEKALKCLTVLSAAISEVIGKLPDKIEAGKEIETFKSVASSVFTRFSALPECAPFFLPQYEVEVDHGDNVVWLPLATQKDKVFTGKALLYVTFLVTAIVKEYGGFLRENGLNMLNDLGEACGLLKT